MTTPILEAHGLTKRFGGLTAVESVDMILAPGEIVGLIGPNGAGKTTIMNLIMGTFEATAGEVVFDGARISALPPHRRVRMGLARTFQIPQAYPTMTVLENVAMAAMFGQRSRQDTARSDRLAREFLDFVGIGPLAQRSASSLPTRDLKLMDLARALATDPRVLLLDELMAGVSPSELGGMLSLIRRINGRGVAILFIEHLMKAVMTVAGRVVVLHRGRKLAEGVPDEIATNVQVIDAYLGAKYQHQRQQPEP